MSTWFPLLRTAAATTIRRNRHFSYRKISAFIACNSCRIPVEDTSLFIQSNAALFRVWNILQFCQTRGVFAGAPSRSGNLPEQLSERRYNELADQALDSLTAFFEDLADSTECGPEYDVTCSNGVLTIRFDSSHIYVINKQTPNKQIWLSSPVSGPKRYDLVNGSWIYIHDGSSLHGLLSDEVSNILGRNIKVDNEHPHH